MTISKLEINDLEAMSSDQIVGKQFEISGALFVDGNNRAWVACDKLADIEGQFRSNECGSNCWKTV